MIESCLHRGPPVLILPPTGECNQMEIRCPGFLPQRTSDFITAQIRHSNVEERYIRTKGLRQGQGGLTQMRDSHVVVPRGDTVLNSGDEVMVLVTPDSEDTVKAILTGR